MKEKKVNKSNKLSSNELNSVAGGHYGDLIVQQIMNMGGFKEEWANTNINGWDYAFMAFLQDNYGEDRTEEIMSRYKDQRDMFRRN